MCWELKPIPENMEDPKKNSLENSTSGKGMSLERRKYQLGLMKLQNRSSSMPEESITEKGKNFLPRTLSEIMIENQIKKRKKQGSPAGAIKEAQLYTGDFNMKTASDYKIPQHMRINTTKKKEKLGHLDSISIQSILNMSRHMPITQIPLIYPGEVPEKISQYDEETLLVIKGINTQPRSPKLMEFAKANPTDVNLEITKRDEIKHLYIQHYLTSRIKELTVTFDAELYLPRNQKMNLDTQIKLSYLHHVTLFQEMLLLKNFEKQENILQEYVNSLDRKELDVQWKMNETLKEKEDKKNEIAKLQDHPPPAPTKKAPYTGFQAATGENNTFGNFLKKVLKRINDKEEYESHDEIFDDSICPTNCDMEKRLDIEEGLVEENKIIITSKNNTIHYPKKEDIELGEILNDLPGTLFFSNHSLEMVKKVSKMEATVCQLMISKSGCVMDLEEKFVEVQWELMTKIKEHTKKLHQMNDLCIKRRPRKADIVAREKVIELIQVQAEKMKRVHLCIRKVVLSSPPIQPLQEKKMKSMHGPLSLLFSQIHPRFLAYIQEDLFPCHLQQFCYFKVNLPKSLRPDSVK
ncbi:unnamed protein product [Nyctereutes procyonoides]|uniref:(raccoon dog) hypothetical protein n=1 Tax=Nyctereutes procyonoides TaxID=34880 RepID=A0A811ZQC3_NYCPR|nr:unnamed protein product [Nyctereutes procyonoides]